ncbi:hypothetical protein WN51_05516 [Melipona quadrifasciata]|uniref:Uncharacterized protein n=1 Tax=Melipona quadrifasciata TaxID=166423 RepID=A0A0N0BDD1_9HYME|nr:hypothetical protein WN51_05516 [Melipona quadrifasciata]
MAENYSNQVRGRGRLEGSLSSTFEEIVHEQVRARGKPMKNPHVLHKSVNWITDLACASADKPTQWTTAKTITTSKRPPLLSHSPPIVKINRTEDIINPAIQIKNRHNIFADCFINELDSGPQNTESHNDITNVKTATNPNPPAKKR